MFQLIADMFISNAIALGIAGILLLLLTGVTYLCERPIHKKYKNHQS